MKILLVRHGYSTSNQTSTFTGILDVELSDLGKQQAKLVCEHIISEYKTDAIYSSDLVRAVDTIKAVSTALNIPIRTDLRLREIYGGKWEGKTPAELREEYPEDYENWLTHVGTGKATGGENFVEVGARVMRFLSEMAEKEYQLEKTTGKPRTVLIGTHAGVIRSIECVVRGVPFEEMEKVPWVTNASVTMLEYNGENTFTEAFSSKDDFLNGLTTSLTVFK